MNGMDGPVACPGKNAKTEKAPAWRRIGISLALCLFPVMVWAQGIDVDSVRRELQREQAALRELNLQIKNAENIFREAERVERHTALVFQEYQKALARGPQYYPYPSSGGFHRLTNQEIYTMVYNKNAYVNNGITLNRAQFEGYREYMNQEAEKARSGLDRLAEESLIRSRSIAFWQWQLVAAGAEPDPLPGTWQLNLRGNITLITVYRDDKGRYAGMISTSGLDHYPNNAVLFTALLNRNTPYNYSGMQIGYTNMSRDSREDEPLQLIVRENTMVYNIRGQSLLWQRVGGER